MEDFLPILIFIIIMIVSFVRNIAKNAGNTERRRQPAGSIGEAFPQMEILPPEIPEPKKQTTRTKKVMSATVKDSAENTTENIANDKRGCKVALNCKSDAKKAFIYSEIFNKKYN